MMKIYLAPLENITTTEYRNTLHQYFGEYIDTYFMPFFMPHIKISLDEKDRRQLDPARNDMTNLVPQILTDDAEGFWRMANGIIDMGYREINLNIGCPSQRVASKGRGAGLLGRKEVLESFLDGVFEKNTIDLSIKTRLGMRDPDEFYELLEIYNKYPLKELIIHVRSGVEKYGGSPHREYFKYALDHSKNPVCYNGDIYLLEDYKAFLKEIDEKGDYGIDRMPAIMIGRGLLANPALAREIKTGEGLKGREMLDFMYSYRERCLKNPRKKQSYFLMNKSKEILGFMKAIYPDRLEQMRELFLCQDLKEYLLLEEKFLLSIS